MLVGTVISVARVEARSGIVIGFGIEEPFDSQLPARIATYASRAAVPIATPRA